MSKMREKTTAILLIAIFMISAFGFIVAASDDYWFTKWGGATAGLIDGGRAPGGKCVKFFVPGGTLDDGKIRFYHDGTLGDFEEFSYWSYVTGYGGQLHPYVVLDVDKDNDDTADLYVVQWEVSNYEPTGENMWIQTIFDDSSLVHVPFGPSGYGQPATKTLGDLKAEDGYSDYKVLQAKLMFGYFSTGLPDMTALVDDITINGELYHFDDRSFFVPGKGKGLDKAIPNDNFANGRNKE